MIAIIAYHHDRKPLDGVSKRIRIHLQPDVFAALQHVDHQVLEVNRSS